MSVPRPPGSPRVLGTAKSATASTTLSPQVTWASATRSLEEAAHGASNSRLSLRFSASSAGICERQPVEKSPSKARGNCAERDRWRIILAALYTKAAGGGLYTSRRQCCGRSCYLNEGVIAGPGFFLTGAPAAG